MTDYYALLGVRHNASDDEIRLAYRKLAKYLHPDVNTSRNAHSQFIEIQKAYEILGDNETRLKYDIQLRQNKSKYNPDFYISEYERKKEAQRNAAEELRRQKHKEFLRKKAALENNAFYYPLVYGAYVIILAILLAIIFVIGSVIYLVYKVHFFLLFIVSPLLCLAVYIFKITLDNFILLNKYTSK